MMNRLSRHQNLRYFLKNIKRVKPFQDFIKSLKKQVHDLHIKEASLTHACSNFKEIKNFLEIELQLKETELDEVKKLVLKCNEAELSAAEKITTHVKRNEELIEEIKIINNELSTLKIEHQQDVTEFQYTLERTRSEERVKNEKKFKEQLDKLESQLSSKDDHIINISNERDKFKKDSEETSETISQLENNLKSKNSEILLLETQIDEMSRKFQERAEKEKQEIETLRQELQCKSMNVSDLECQLNEYQANQKIRNENYELLQISYAESKENIQFDKFLLHVLLDNESQNINECIKHSSQNQQTAALFEELNKKYIQTLSHCQILEAQILDKETELESVRGENNSFIESKLKNSNGKVKELEEHIEYIEEQLSIALEQLELSKSNLTTKEYENHQLEADLTKCKMEMSAMQEKIDHHLSFDANGLKNELANLQDNNNLLTEQIESVINEKTYLVSQLRTLELSLESFKMLKKESENNFILLEQEKRDVEMQILTLIESTNKEKEELQMKVMELKENLKDSSFAISESTRREDELRLELEVHYSSL